MSDEIVTGCIRHKDMRHLRLYCDYMQLYKLNEHKAKIVRVLETWTDSKRNEWYKAALDGKEQGQVPPEPDFWITMSFQQFRYFLYETASVDTIKRNVTELIEKDKHIQRRVNPDNPYGPPQYLLNYKALQKSLNKLPSPSFLPDIPTMEDIPPGENTPPPENQPLPQGSNLPLPRGENYPHPRGENTPPSNNRDKNTSNNNEIDYVSAHADSTPASESEQPSTERRHLPSQEQPEPLPIAIADPLPTSLQAEQEKVTQAELSTTVVDKQASGVDKSSKPKKAKDETLAKRIDDVYAALDTFKQEVMNDPETHFQRTKIGTKEITDLLVLKPTLLKLRKVFYDMWNEKDPKTGEYFWRKHMSPQNVCRHYEARLLGLEGTEKKPASQHHVKAAMGAVISGLIPRQNPSNEELRREAF